MRSSGHEGTARKICLLDLHGLKRVKSMYELRSLGPVGGELTIKLRDLAPSGVRFAPVINVSGGRENGCSVRLYCFGEVM